LGLNNKGSTNFNGIGRPYNARLSVKICSQLKAVITGSAVGAVNKAAEISLFGKRLEISVTMSSECLSEEKLTLISTSSWRSRPWAATIEDDAVTSKRARVETFIFTVEFAFL
jgi:hypothetical protein